MTLRCLALGLVAVAAACTPELPNDAHRVDGGHNDFTYAPFDATGLAVTSIAVSPATATLDVTDPAMLPSLQLSAIATYQGGGQAPISASWTLDRYDVASVDSAGLLTAGGGAYAKVIVTATAEGLTATGEVTVRLKATVTDGNVPVGEQAILDGAAATDAAVTGLLYPYDRTVFPRALIAPELMWRGGADADSYRLRITSTNFELTVYTKVPNPSRYQMSQPLWNALGASAVGGDATVELRRLSGGNAFVSASQVWTLANAVLRGSIYYWAIDVGQIVKLDVSTGMRTLAFDSGPNTALGSPAPVNSGTPANPVWESNGAGKRCVACHSVSKDGSKLNSVFARELSYGPVGTVSLANQQVVSVSDYQANTRFSTLTPDGSLVVANLIAKTMKLLDTSNGLPIASALDTLTDLCDPMFSPDGTKMALATVCDPGFGDVVEYRRANLGLYDFAQPTRTFSNFRTVVTSAGIGDAIAFPSFTPDSSMIIYQRGSYSRAKYGVNQHGVDDLYISAAQATAAAIPLDKANGKDVLPADSLHLNYAPTVNPIASGGYVWVVFTSPRDYGNRMLSPQQAAPMDATYANRKQLWVAAVNTGGVVADPSHPAFWLPGQDPATVNMFGYWSLSPCKMTGPANAPVSCSAGFECCSGYCRDNGMGPICVDAPMGCHLEGEKCTVNADCCAGLECIAGICQRLVK